MNKDKVLKIAEEATRLLFDNPSWTYDRAIKTAKEMITNNEVHNKEYTSI